MPFGGFAGEEDGGDDFEFEDEDVLDVEEEAWRDLDDFDLDPSDDWTDFTGNEQVAKAAARADFGSVLLSVLCCCGCRGGLAGVIGALAAWADSVLVALQLSQQGTEETLALNQEKYRRVRTTLN